MDEVRMKIPDHEITLWAVKNMRKQISLWNQYIFDICVKCDLPDASRYIIARSKKLNKNSTKSHILISKNFTPSHGIPSFPTRLVLSLAPVLILKKKDIRTTISDFNEFIMTWIISIYLWNFEFNF